MTAVTLAVVCGVVGLGIDTAVWYANADDLEKIVEVSALSAGRMLSGSQATSTSVTAVAKNDAMLNGLATSTDSISVSFSPGAPPAATTVTVTATRTLPRTFSALFLGRDPSVTTSATARATAGPCVLVLGSGSQTLLVNGNFNLNATGCMIDVASSNSNAAVFDSSLPDVEGVCVNGGVTLNGGSTVNGLQYNQRGACSTTNPYVNQIPAPTTGNCTVNSQNYSGTVSLRPGTYCGTFNFNGSGTANLAPGTYILDGTNWNINSGWTVTGTGVTFYFANSSSYVQFNSGVTVSLTAPTSGSYANVLMFEPDGLSTSSFAIDGTSSSGHALQGLIYLPSRNITFNSTYSGTADSFGLVVNQLIFDANSPNTWSISPPGGTAGSAASVLIN